MAYGKKDDEKHDRGKSIPSDFKSLNSLNIRESVSGFFYSLLVPVNCLRMTVQAFGNGGAAMLSGVSELLARGLMSVCVTPVLGYISVCFTDQAAWALATIVISTIYMIVIKKLEKRGKKYERAGTVL